MKEKIKARGRGGLRLCGHRLLQTRSFPQWIKHRRGGEEGARLGFTGRPDRNDSRDCKSKAARAGVFHGMSEADLQKFMRCPNTMVACDSGIREFGEGVPHPRGYGNNARVLGHYVREMKMLRLEDAIRKMTSLPANTFRLKRSRRIARRRILGRHRRFSIRKRSATPRPIKQPASLRDGHSLRLGERRHRHPGWQAHRRETGDGLAT